MRKVKRTTYKKKKKVTVQSEAIGAVTVETMPGGKKKDEPLKVLTADHFRHLQVRGVEVRNTQLLMAVEEQNLKNLTLALDNLSLKIQGQRTVVARRAQEYESMKKSHSAFVKGILPIYGIKEGENLGYNPDTGEIVYSQK